MAPRLVVDAHRDIAWNEVALNRDSFESCGKVRANERAPRVVKVGDR